MSAVRDTTPVLPPVPKPVPFLHSHRFYALVSSVSGGVLLAVKTVAMVSPVAGTVMTLLGAFLAIVGGAGSAYYGMTSNRAVQWTGKPATAEQ